MSQKDTDKKICKIDDPRLATYTRRQRSGHQQVFYTGTDSRDFERYKADGGGVKPNVKMYDKPDTITIIPPKQSYYADLIDGEWWWVEGCAECNGQPRDWMTYIECDDHNVCRTCKTHRSKIEGAAWGGKHGWQCNSCKNAEHEAEKAAALAAMPDEYDEWDYRSLSSIKCPYCDYEYKESHQHCEDDDEKHECPRCENEFLVTAEISVSFTSKRIEGGGE